MNPRRVLAITRRLLSQFRRDRRTLALFFVVPIVVLSLLYFLVRGSGQHPAVGVINQDSGPLGGAIATQLLKSDRVRASEMTEERADAGLHDGSLAAYIVLPADFSSRALQGHVIAPEVHLEGSQPGPSGTVLQALSQSLAAAASSASAPGVASVRLEPKISYLYGGPDFDTLDYFGAAFIGLFVFFLVFIITSVAFLRERSQGTLERLMASPLRRGEIVLGYMIGFGVLALLQAAEVLVFSLYVLKVHNSGNVFLIFLVEALMAIAAVNLGIFLSTFARSEFEAVQFIPLVIVPQVLLSGIIFPVSSEPQWLQYVSNVLPLTFAVNGMRDIMVRGQDLTAAALQLNVGVIFGFCGLVILLGATTLRRRLA
ncbi:MAG TPA: ABC transporter permease [Candidatus Acidoferrales bacterium]|nr:ABC transporter permease [Candidatus Acidoferrales bacterium]